MGLISTTSLSLCGGLLPFDFYTLMTSTRTHVPRGQAPPTKLPEGFSDFPSTITFFFFEGRGRGGENERNTSALLILSTGFYYHTLDQPYYSFPSSASHSLRGQTNKTEICQSPSKSLIDRLIHITPGPLQLCGSSDATRQVKRNSLLYRENY